MARTQSPFYVLASVNPYIYNHYRFLAKVIIIQNTIKFRKITEYVNPES